MKTGRRAAFLLLSGLIGAAAACSSFSGTNPADVQGSDASDDAGEDHTVPVVTGNAPDAGIPNLLKDGTFESNCMAWAGDHLSVTWETAHTHNHSNGACRVCFLGDNSSSGTITVTGEFGAGPDRQLQAQVFLLADVEAPALEAYIRTNLLGSPKFGGGPSGPDISLTTSDWTLVALPASFESKDALGASVTIDVFTKDPLDSGTGTTCFYVDDASLYFTTN